MAEFLNLLKKAGGFLEGHFLLSSGRHSAQYLQCALLLSSPPYAEKACRSLAEKFSEQRIDKVISPAVGGIVVGQEVARALKVRAVFAEREGGKLCLRRGFRMEKEERVLVVEDVVTTGGSVKEVIDLVREEGAFPVAVGMLIDRSGGEVDFGIPSTSLATLSIETFLPENCPLCKRGIPISKPGSRKEGKL